MKKILIAFMAIIFTGIIFAPVSASDEMNEGIEINYNNFPDENFRKYIRLYIDKDKNKFLSEEEINETELIDVSGSEIMDMTGIGFFSELNYLDCSKNVIPSLDISNNILLDKLYCSGNQLTSLDISNNILLDKLSCSNNHLTSLDIKNNTALTLIVCYDNKLTSLDISNNILLEELSCSNNQLTSLDTSKNAKLTGLSCANNQITSLDLSNNTALVRLYCSNNNLLSLDVSKNTCLKGLYGCKNYFIQVDISELEDWDIINHDGTLDPENKLLIYTGESKPIVTPTPMPSPTPSPIPTRMPSPTPKPTPTKVPSPTPKPTPTKIPNPTPTPTPTVTPTPTPRVTPTPTVTPTIAPTLTPTIIPTPTAQPTPQPDPNQDEIEYIQNSKPAITSLKSGKGKITIQFVPVYVEGINYQIQYKKGNGSWNEQHTSIIRYSLKGLKRKKTYSIQVRAYKEIGGITYYGQWSDIKKTKTK